jgi:hypothetical protein
MGKRRIASFVGALALGLVSSAAIAGQHYMVSTRLARGGQLLGTPSILVEAGKQAAISVAGPQGYKLDLTVTDAGNGNVKIATVFNAAHDSVSPGIITPLGKKARITVGDLALDMTVKPSDHVPKD